MINLLKKRGTAIAKLDFEGMRDYEREITDLIMNTQNGGQPKLDGEGYEIVDAINDPDDVYEDLTRPVCAFITFSSDDGYQEALNFSKKGWFRRKMEEGFFCGCGKVEENDDGSGPLLLGKSMLFTAASEPTNIIWENRHIKGGNYYGRFLAAILWLTVLIAGAFVIIYIAKKESIHNARTESKVNCNEYRSEILNQHP